MDSQSRCLIREVQSEDSQRENAYVYIVRQADIHSVHRRRFNAHLPSTTTTSLCHVNVTVAGPENILVRDLLPCTNLQIRYMKFKDV